MKRIETENFMVVQEEDGQFHAHFFGSYDPLRGDDPSGTGGEEDLLNCLGKQLTCAASACFAEADRLEKERTGCR